MDGLNRRVDSDVTETGGVATLTIASDAWRDGSSGYGRIELARTDGDFKSIEISERFRILPGLAAEREADYFWYWW